VPGLCLIAAATFAFDRVLAHFAFRGTLKKGPEILGIRALLRLSGLVAQGLPTI
jgi:hypothetical protein